MRRWLINVAKNETILIVAAILALISCFIVPPDADYKSYIHASTISQLICLMIVVCGFQRIGVFRIIGSRLLEKVSTMRGLVITLVALTFFSAMFITNDVALADMSFWTGAAHQPRSFFYLDKETLSLHVFHTMNCRAMLCPYIRLHHCVAGQTRIPYVAGSYQWNIVSFEEEER